MLQRSGTWIGASARDIARAVRRGDTSATAAVADHFDAIASHDRIVNAFRLVRPEAAAEAEIVDDQPDLGSLALAGVPIGVSENTGVTGLPLWNGSNGARQPVADCDHEVVRRLRGAGAVVLGLTRMAELGLFASADDSTGVTRNPWRTDRTAGGACGGAAAAVAAGLVPLAQGTDELGALRNPAACCGLVAVTPGQGVGPGEHGLVATTVGDAALGFFVLAGRNPLRLVPPRRLRIACSAHSPVPAARPDTGARRALTDVARTLARVGHDVISASPSYPVTTGLRGFALWCAGGWDVAASAGLDVAELQSRSRWHLLLGKTARSHGLARTVDRAAWRERCRGWFTAGRFDVLVTPALATAPPRADGWADRSWTANVLSGLRYAPYAAPWSVAGFPSVVVPAGVRPDGLPAAAMLIGPPGSELTLLALAGQLEQLMPWRRYAAGWPRRVSGGHPARFTPNTPRT